MSMFVFYATAALVVMSLAVTVLASISDWLPHNKTGFRYYARLTVGWGLMATIPVLTGLAGGAL